MNQDPRCCGSGACLIDREGRGWCGQGRDGRRMVHAPLPPPGDPGPAAAAP